MDLKELRAIKDYSYIEIVVGDTLLKLNTSNSIELIHQDNNIYIKISLQVFSDDVIELYKDIIRNTLEGNDYYIRIQFNVNELDMHGNKFIKKNIIHCSFGIPNNVSILNIDYTTVSDIDYYFKVNDIDELNL